MSNPWEGWTSYYWSYYLLYWHINRHIRFLHFSSLSVTSVTVLDTRDFYELKQTAWSVTSNRNLPRARVDTQQPINSDPFKSHFISPSVAAGKSRGAKVFVPNLWVSSKGRLRAMLPKAPEALPANKHTIRQQERDDRPRQRVIIVRVSAESQSESPSSRQEPQRRICAVLWSWLSQRKSKETNTGASTSAAHSASLCREVRYGLEGCKREIAAEIPSRKKPTEGALWTCRERMTKFDTGWIDRFTNVKWKIYGLLLKVRCKRKRKLK